VGAYILCSSLFNMSLRMGNLTLTSQYLLCGLVIWVVGIERRELTERRRLPCYSTRWCYSRARAARAREAGRGALPTAEQEENVFLLNSCLIRLIHLLFLYREVYLTRKQDLLDS
jgi:hypothetical protein